MTAISRLGHYRKQVQGSGVEASMCNIKELRHLKWLICSVCLATGNTNHWILKHNVISVEKFHTHALNAYLERFTDVFTRFSGLTICVNFSAQMSWLVFLLFGRSDLLYYNSAHVAVGRDGAGGSRTVWCMKMSTAWKLLENNSNYSSYLK